jgi:outer membrane protein TolC
MRVKAQISASVRVAVAGAITVCLFGSGSALSASGQTPGQAPATAQTTPSRPLNASAAPTVLKITPDEAVRMALENNLGVQADRLSPQIQTYGVAGAKAAYAITLGSTTTTRSATQPPTDFLTGESAVLTNDSFRTNAGIGQLVPWGGGRYTLGIDAARSTTSNPTGVFNPQLDSALAATYTQPLLRNFTFDSARQNVAISQTRQEIADIQLRQTLTQTSRTVRNAYFNLVNAKGQLQVAQKSLELAQTSLRNNEKKVQLGTIAPIDIVQAEAEVARTEEQVIVAEGQIESAEDALRVLIMNPSQPDFWTTKLEPGEQPTLAPQPINVDAAIANALANRTDLLQTRKSIDETDINMKYLRNQKMPALDVIGAYNVVGTAGTQRVFDYTQGVIPPPILRQSQRSFGSALGDVFANDFKTWSLQFVLSYPLGTSQADAGLAQSRLQRDQQATNLRDLETVVVAQVRDAARQVATALKRVETTQKAKQLAEQNLQAYEKRLAVGLSDTFLVIQAQRDLTTQLNNELAAIIAYNRALINFEAVQTVPPGGGF